MNTTSMCVGIPNCKEIQRIGKPYTIGIVAHIYIGLDRWASLSTKLKMFHRSWSGKLSLCGQRDGFLHLY